MCTMIINRLIDSKEEQENYFFYQFNLNILKIFRLIQN